MARLALPNRLTRHTSFNAGGKPGSTLPSRSTSPNGPHGDHKNGSLILKAKVIKGRGLAPKDKTGTSDPYLVLTLGDAKEATAPIPKTLDPEWNETLELPIVGVQSLVLEVACWDKDRIGKDYMGEVEVPVEDIFSNGNTAQEPKWYKLESKRTGRKKSIVTGEVLLEFSIDDPQHSLATPQQILQKLKAILVADPSPRPHDDEEDEDEDQVSRVDSVDQYLDGDDEEAQESVSDLPEGAGKQEMTAEKKNERRLARLKKKAKQRAFEFNGKSSVAGVLFLEISRITDLPPERNMTRTSFDMDPFVVVSLGKKTYRTRVIRHNLNPVFEEKMVFQVAPHEVNYSLNFAVVDRDKLSGNDFVGTANFSLEGVISLAPQADPETGLYHLKDTPEEPPSNQPTQELKKPRFRLPLSRSSSFTSIHRLGRPSLKRSGSSSSLGGNGHFELPLPPTSIPLEHPHNGPYSEHDTDGPRRGGISDGNEDVYLKNFEFDLIPRKKEKWQEKHKPVLHVRAKYMPYKALRQQFWRSMLRQYDADDSGRISKVELTTMLDTLGSTLHESTIDGWFTRFAGEKNVEEATLTIDQAIICLEDELHKVQEKMRHHSLGEKTRDHLPSTHTASITTIGSEEGKTSGARTPSTVSSDGKTLNEQWHTTAVPVLDQTYLGKDGEEGAELKDDLSDEKGEEHVVEIAECPICNQPRLNKKTDADIITHIATCASQDWRQVNNIVMGGFVTSSQAQRKWYSKVITKIGYGGYKLGANSANILVQDRITGQINEERMSVYVRLGIRLLYKGLKSREMEKKRIRKLLRSMSFKQGRKYDDPASAAEIQTFINFHKLDMSEVLLRTDQFKSFNDFFYRKLKPEARPCSAPDRPEIVTSPADCRTVVFNRMEDAQRIWVKGREFSVERLLGHAYPQDAKRYVNGGLGIFRLAPQDYHRFHIPVDGVLNEPKLIEGEYYTVNPMAIRSALDVYGENVRVVVPIDSVAHGRVMVICVGAMMVGSTVITRKAGERVKRAEELGYFKFGGSTILLLFEPGMVTFDQDLVDNSMSKLETLIRAGMSIGHSPDTPPHTPDMRKEGATHEERQDAKRRIEGSLAPESKPSIAAQMS